MGSAFCSARLASHWPDRTIHASRLQELMDQAEEMVAAVAGAEDLDVELRLW